MPAPRPAYGLPEIVTEQSVFDHVVTHLFTQGRQALGEDGKCAYRGINGTACGVGCLISDDRYDTSMEGLQVTHPNVIDFMPELKPIIGLCKFLQRAHDSKEACRADGTFDFEKLSGLLRTAAGWRIRTDVIDRFAA